MQINEIFSSIDGEGIRTGYLVTFIRTFGCNLLCKYCDTLYSVKPQTEEDKQNAFKVMSVDEVIQKCDELGNRRITFTGGEPLIQKDAEELISKLTSLGYEVNIETNGAAKLDKINHKYPNLIWTMDWKSPYSGMRDKMLESNLDYLTETDVLKFVVANIEDLNDMKQTITEHDLKCHIFVSPVYGQMEGKDIVEFMKVNNLQNVRVQVQLHKIWWDPSTRGV